MLLTVIKHYKDNSYSSAATCIYELIYMYQEMSVFVKNNTFKLCKYIYELFIIISR